MISKPFLIEKRASIVSQRDNALAVYHQAVGALALVDHLIEMADQIENGMSLETFAEAINADGAEIVDLKQVTRGE
jgi:hypothetical protein